ncbi:MAG: hypothetical protein LBL99_00205 [Holosporaceae bacterium]|nr:hypothetical protein [Holosporaceae bacterium]
MKYQTSPEFDKDLKRYRKKFSSLEDDIENLKKFSIEPFHNEKINNESIFLTEECNSDKSNKFESYVVKKIRCRDLKGKGCKSGFRLTYVLNKQLNEITFIELYSKADQEIEDKERIKDFIKNQKS